MDCEDLIDELIADGFKKVTLYSHMLITDDDYRTQQYFLFDENGHVAAKNLKLPGCSGWTIVHWPGALPRSSDLRKIWDIDLTKRDEALTRMCIFY
ncbi:hypothetical protein R2217_004035 [Cronobacter turicensis]|uniref:hypothetical protein n=1 Tax=Cronobacter dublinensis TaxID=413497 RepID=UPI0023DD483B|nr:hypothetical protein [Cronobacter dublinensis]ELQ6022971.1 hypothetical protein [Cronobacter turicensis]ELQ6077822.1 hypothetical protein [Cronobacter turicensis]ELQ6184814.1 hypothetical protein [Cronobacter turicensis]ELQ6235506.1 hypothetical protein [Cronobacter turicensis]ELQ6239758.1 hypothetical protein [Cronobacter turicensis]